MNKTYNMKKVIRLTESDLKRIVKRVIEEREIGEGSPFTLGDRVKNRVIRFLFPKKYHFVLGDNISSNDIKQLCSDIYDSVKKGDYTDFKQNMDKELSVQFDVHLFDNNDGENMSVSDTGELSKNIDPNEYIYTVGIEKMDLIDDHQLTIMLIIDSNGETIQVTLPGYINKILKLLPVKKTGVMGKFKFPKK